MELLIEKSLLLKNLQIVSKAIPARSTLPILGCALFSQKNNTLNIRTTDLEIAISVSCEVEGKVDGCIAVPISKLLEITNAMPSGDMKISTSDIGKLSIDCQQGQYTIMGQPQDEFPSEINIEETQNLEINSTELKNIINNTMYAASKDDLKPVLQGVLFNIGEKGLTSVATDGHRLVKFEQKGLKETGFQGSVVVPTKYLKLLYNYLENDKKVNLQISDNHINVELQKGNITSRIIKDPFPDYESVIPKDNTNILIVDKTIFTDAIKRVSIFSNKASKQVSLSISDNELLITTEDSENITSGKEKLECTYEGEPMSIGYNATYLSEVLQHQNSEEVKILLKSPLNAGLFLPVDKDKGENKTTLLMPIRLNE